RCVRVDNAERSTREAVSAICNLAFHHCVREVRFPARCGVRCRELNDDLAETFLQMIDDMQLTVQLDVLDKSGRTPLHLALRFGNKKAVKALLRRGVDPNLANKKGSTARHQIALRMTDDDLVEKFFEICSDIRRTVQLDAANKFGRTP
ncbi:unnamed protein product, partial [Trichogramma brassicae]